MNILRAERQFGRVVGILLVGLGAWRLYRGVDGVLTTLVLAGGGLLVALAVVWPRALVHPYRAWMRLADALSFVSTRVILAIAFFLGVVPLGLLMRLRGRDPLAMRARTQDGYWMPYPKRQHDRTHYDKMY
jgi:saxitoxin biosynthesis operon SxtJ-like protein